MTISEPTVPQQASRSSTAAVPFFIAMGACVVVLVVLFAVNPYAFGYGSTQVSITEFANVMYKDPKGDWVHCYLVPIAVAVMVYLKRKSLRLEDLGQSGPRPVRTDYASNWLGGVNYRLEAWFYTICTKGALAIILFGLATYWLGYRADSIYFGYAAFQLLTAGFILYFCGLKWFKVLFFPWAFLGFLYPVPFLDAIAFKLRWIMSNASVFLLNVVGIGAVKEGTAILSTPNAMTGLKAGEIFSVDVADPCSGIRSLFALMMVSALYGYFTQPGIWRKAFIFLCAAPLAILGNLARIMMLTIGTIAFGSNFAIGTEEDPSTFHMLAGFFVFGVALAALMGISGLLDTDWKKLFHRVKGEINSRPPRPPRTPPPGAKPVRVHDEY